jgi:16S rRNA (guanine966-N2)-methyltransferase
VRVISGKAKGKRLKAPSRARPLTDQAKEALFNILRERISGCYFLDLFAGSGAVGIEALSRGAAKATFVELDRKAVAIIRQNLRNAGFAGETEVYALDVMRALKLLGRKPEKFDIIFIGAPYDSPALEPVLTKLAENEILNESAIVVAEHRKQHQLQNEYGKLKLFRDAKYGETVLSLYAIREI